MDKKTAEVFYWISEHANEIGEWFRLCEYLGSKGVSPKQIADAINAAAKVAGFVSGISEEDCK